MTILGAPRRGPQVPASAAAFRSSRLGSTARNTFGSAATYGQAFLAIDWLIERYGPEKLHEFEPGLPESVLAGRLPIPYRQFEFRARMERRRCGRRGGEL